MASYAIRGGEEGKHRLDLLARIMAPSTEALLTRAGVRPGMRCIDLGCGGGHVSRHLAECVGESGYVVGLDMDEVKLAAARQECGEAGLRQVEFRKASVADWAESQVYDLVYGRFILSHLTDPAAVVTRMAMALRPGGVVVLEDIDFGGAFCHPPNAGHERYCTLYRAVIGRRGGNAELGRQLHAMCLDAGLADVDVYIVQPVHHGHEPGKAMALRTLINIGDSLIAEGLATAADLVDVVAELTRYTQDPRSVIGLPRVFQVRGRSPLAAG